MGSIIICDERAIAHNFEQSTEDLHHLLLYRTSLLSQVDANEDDEGEQSRLFFEKGPMLVR